MNFGDSAKILAAAPKETKIPRSVQEVMLVRASLSLRSRKMHNTICFKEWEKEKENLNSEIFKLRLWYQGRSEGYYALIIKTTACIKV